MGSIVGAAAGGALSSRRPAARDRDERDYNYDQDESFYMNQGERAIKPAGPRNASNYDDSMEQGGEDGNDIGGYARQGDDPFNGQGDDGEQFAPGEHPLEAAVPNFAELPNPEPLSGKTKYSLIYI
jgi:hypothetical protein